MNYYPHHIGDYLTATAHLSWLEDAAYRRLLDVYYSREQPIPLDLAQAARLVRAASKDERKAVETVLREFFTETQQGWMHHRCEEEIEKAQVSAERARANGKKGGRKPKPNPEETQSVISGLAKQNPDESNCKAPNPNTHYSVPIGTDGDAVAKPPADMAKDELWRAGRSLLQQAGIPEAQARSGIGKLCRDYGNGTVVEAVRSAVLERPVDPMAYLMAACQHAAGQRKKPDKPNSHAGFDQKDYSKGVMADGTIA